MTTEITKPELFYCKDDGKIPNSPFSVVLYRQVFALGGKDGALWLEQLFSSNNWTNSWRNGIYSYHHYHSTAHEVLGIYEGSATLQLGGEEGKKIKVAAGDIIVIPAGVGHKNLENENELCVVGAYHDGRSWDLLKGEKDERPEADKNIAAVPFPTTDPVLGKNDGILTAWKQVLQAVE